MAGNGTGHNHREMYKAKRAVSTIVISILALTAVGAPRTAAAQACAGGETEAHAAGGSTITLTDAQEIGQSFTAPCRGFIESVTVTVGGSSPSIAGTLRLYVDATETEIDAEPFSITSTGAYTVTFPAVRPGVTAGTVYRFFFDVNEGESGGAPLAAQFFNSYSEGTYYQGSNPPGTAFGFDLGFTVTFSNDDLPVELAAFADKDLCEKVARLSGGVSLMHRLVARCGRGSSALRERSRISRAPSTSPRATRWREMATSVPCRSVSFSTSTICVACRRHWRGSLERSTERIRESSPPGTAPPEGCRLDPRTPSPTPGRSRSRRRRPAPRGRLPAAGGGSRWRRRSRWSPSFSMRMSFCSHSKRPDRRAAFSLVWNSSAPHRSQIQRGRLSPGGTRRATPAPQFEQYFKKARTARSARDPAGSRGGPAACRRG